MKHYFNVVHINRVVLRVVDKAAGEPIRCVGKRADNCLSVRNRTHWRSGSGIFLIYCQVT